MIANQVLNRKDTIICAYRALNIPRMLWNIGNLPYNCLVVGRAHCWLINCKTNAKGMFMGTERKICMYDKLHTKHNWTRLRELAMRFATTGAQIEVFCFDSICDLYRPVTTFCKSHGTFYQPPGCTMPCMNGINIPSNVQLPI